MTDDERWWTSSLAAQFIAGEEAVTEDLQPFLRRWPPRAGSPTRCT